MPDNMAASLDAITKLDVILAGEPVGTLAQTPDGPLAFQYAESWVENGYSISPFSLPLTREVHIAKPSPLDGVFGVFDDSMPDGWGRLLLDRMLREKGIDPCTVGPLARLAIVGTTGMGALEYHPAQEMAPLRVHDDLDVLAKECAELLENDHVDDIDTLFALGGSSGGARPKILTTIDDEDWIIKFPSSYDPRNIGESEYCISQAAEDCGIEMSESRLLPSRLCSGFFATKRFDRKRVIDGSGSSVVHKIHMASAGAFLETSHRIPNLDYDLLFKLTMMLTNDAAEVKKLFRLVVFNILCGNQDDHAKNFTFVHEPEKGWRLSPAYDLTHNSGMNGERATTVNGKGRDITLADIVEVAERIGISKTAVHDEVERIATALNQHGCDLMKLN